MSAKPLHYSKPGKRLARVGPDLGEVGAGLLGFDTVMPMQRELWALLEARRAPVKAGLPLHENTAIEVPRRAGKTEGLFSLAIGRCATLEAYDVTYCAQSGTKSRERFYGLLRRLRRHGEALDFRARESRGEERIEFGNGSIMRFLPPKASSFRGDAIDWLILDEGQEVDEADAADLIGSVMPVFDTREDAQLTVAGTAGGSRSGLLWDALEKGRAGHWGILEYAAAEGLDPESPATWLRTHPGPAGVSQVRALEVLHKRFSEMSLEMFCREYLGLWPEGAGSAAFSAELWAQLGAESPALPSRFGLAFDCTPSGDRSSVVAAWRDAEGTAWVEVIRDEPGTAWVAPFVAALVGKHRVPVGYDTGGPQTLAVADEIARKHRTVKLRGLVTREFAASCASFAGAVTDRTFRHSRQPALDLSVSSASRRPILDGGWGWGRRVSSGSIAPLVAATVALRMADDLPAARVSRVLTARPA